VAGWDVDAAVLAAAAERGAVDRAASSVADAVEGAEVAFLCAEAPLLPPGHRVFVLYAADGTPILLADSREAAMADAAHREIETVSLH